MSVRFFNPSRAYEKIKPEIDAAMQDVLARGDLILRKDLEEFETKFAAYVGTKYVIGVASGTDAIILSLKVAGIQQGDEVLVPDYTFRATIEAIHHAGAIPVLVPRGEDWHYYKTEKTRAIIPCHIAGEVMDWLPDPDVFMVEDACQAVGAAPVTGLTACYSFYPAKVLGCYGDGGAIATNNDQLAAQLKIMRNHFKGDWNSYGYNSRLDNLQAAVLNVKLKYLPEQVARRREIAQRYDAELKGVGLPARHEVYQDYIIEHAQRDELFYHMTASGIETMLNEYPFPLGLEKSVGTKGYESVSLRIPCNAELTDDEVTLVIAAINAFSPD